MTSIITMDDQLQVTFDRFDLAAYETFLACKKLPEYRLGFERRSGTYVLTAPARFGRLLGIEPPRPAGTDLPLPARMWDYQRFITHTALQARRYAVWADCGLGKTFMFWEWARHVRARTKGRVLVCSPLQIVEQSIEQAGEFMGPEFASQIRWLHSREDLIEWCKSGPEPFGIVNYEKFIPGVINELRHLAGLVLDESSVLKTGGGKIKWSLIKSARGIEYKLSCTATPAPNDAMEYASQAAFLEVLRHEGEILWTYFSKDKQGEWYIKPHAKAAFFRFMSGWSIYLRDPAAYGFKDNAQPLPEPIIEHHAIEITPEQQALAASWTMAETGDFLATERMGITTRGRLSQIAKGFYYTDQDGEHGDVRVASNKPDVVARMIRQEAREGNPVLVWTVFDEEADILMERLRAQGAWADLVGVRVLTGRTPKKERQQIIDDFRHGKVRVLITRARMLGYGMNFHHVGSMIFSGWNDSFEQWYQAIRRAYRHGQTRRLRILVPVIAALEGKVLENVMEKQARWLEETRIQEINYRQAMRELLIA